MHSDSRVLDNFFFSISVKFLISRVFDLSETAHFVCLSNEKFTFLGEIFEFMSFKV